MEGGDQGVVARVGVGVDGLQAAGAVDVGYCGDQGALGLADLVDLHHERHVAVLLEPFAHGALQHGGGEGAEGLAALDLQVQDVFHVGTARVADDGAVAQGARAPFHAALEPADAVPST